MKRILALILALLLLCSCAAAPKTGRVSEEKLAKLREQYPYRDVDYTLYVPKGAYFQHPGEYDLSFRFYQYIYLYEREFTVAAVEIQSEPYYKTVHKDYPGKFKDLDDFMQQYPDLNESTAKLIFDEGSLYVDALATEVICGNSALPAGELFDLAITGAAMDFEPENTLALYAKGSRLVCFLTPRPGAGIHTTNAHTTALEATWYLTKDDVVLSSTQGPGPEAVSGLYLESFKQEVQAIWEKYNKE